MSEQGRPESSGFQVPGLGFEVWGSGFRVSVPARIQSSEGTLGFRVQSLGCSVDHSSGFRVWVERYDLGSRVLVYREMLGLGGVSILWLGLRLWVSFSFRLDSWF